MQSQQVGELALDLIADSLRALRVSFHRNPSPQGERAARQAAASARQPGSPTTFE
jgi:hypothetical protein